MSDLNKENTIPLCLENVPGAPSRIEHQHLFSLPEEPIAGSFVGEEIAGVVVSYIYAQRYKKWLLFSMKTFCGAGEALLPESAWHICRKRNNKLPQEKGLKNERS